MPNCPQGVTILLYNDKEGWGLAHTTDTFKPPEITVTTKVSNDKVWTDAVTLEAIEPQKDVWFGEKLKHRWDEVELDGR